MPSHAANVLRDLVLTTPPNAGAGILELMRSAPLARRLAKLPLEDQRAVIGAKAIRLSRGAAGQADEVGDLSTEQCAQSL